MLQGVQIEVFVGLWFLFWLVFAVLGSVFPACAGASLSYPCSVVRCLGLPRMRGGESMPAYSRIAVYMLPACAGVNHTKITTLRTEAGIPCIGGVGPSKMGVSPAPHKCFPNVWGESRGTLV